MSHALMLRRPGLFFGLFALVTALSLPVWDVLSAYYMQGVVWLVNGALSIVVPAVRLPTSLGGEGVYPGLAGAIALFAVTPKTSWRWKARWTGLLMATMVVVHAALLLAQTVHALEGEAPSLPVRLASTWGTSGLVIWVWFIAMRRRDRATVPVERDSPPDV